MAITLNRFSYINYILRRSVGLRSYSSAFREDHDFVVITDDGSTVVCWHPEKKFPYEMSQPIPAQQPVEDSILKVQSSESLSAILKPKKPEQMRAELMAITHTTKHRWFPKNWRLRVRRLTPDRPFL